MSVSTSYCDNADVWVIDQHDDEYAWEAIVYVDGVTYFATYVAARLWVRLDRTERPRRRRAWHVDTVRVWALAQLLELSPAWHAQHEILHGLHEQREAVRRAVIERLVVA